jgi:hypothetical protein
MKSLSGDEVGLSAKLEFLDTVFLGVTIELLLGDADVWTAMVE